MDSHPNSLPPFTTHQDNARDHDHEPLSPVFADSAIGMDVSTPPPPPPLSHVPDDETLERTVRLADRLADLAHRTADKKNTATGGNSSRRFSKDDTVVLQQCLDTIQKTLLVFDEDENGGHDDIKEKVGDDEEKDDYDPRPGLTHELTKYRRPQSPTTSTVKSETETQPASSSPQPPPSLSENSNDATTEIAEQRERQPQQEKQFTALLDEVSTLGSELDQRRNESFYIYNLFTLQTQRLERGVSLLENEIHELLVYILIIALATGVLTMAMALLIPISPDRHADILQNSIEREGLRGTVYGLESWVDGCQQDHQRAITTNRAQAREAQKKRWTKKRRPADNLGYDSESEALFEGITAWMRGWKDIDEGFRVRERERELRREERAKMRLEDVGANGDEESGLQHHTNFHFLMQVIPKIHDP